MYYKVSMLIPKTIWKNLFFFIWMDQDSQGDEVHVAADADGDDDEILPETSNETVRSCECMIDRSVNELMC